MIVPVGIRQVSWYWAIPAGSIVSLVVSVLGYRVQFWCLQFSNHVLELGRFKPRKITERTAEPQAIQFNGAAEHYLIIKSTSLHMEQNHSVGVGGALD